MSAGEQLSAGNFTQDAESTQASVVEQRHVEVIPGPFVKSLGGADISWIVGFAVASLLYLAGARRFSNGQQALPAAAGDSAS